MRRCVKIIKILIIFCCLFWSGVSKSATLEEVELAAYASLAVYEGQIDKLPGLKLHEEGYKITPFVVDKNHTLLLQKGQFYVLAIAGTESKSGLKKNMKTSLSMFDLEEGAYAHKGYNDLAKSYMVALEIQNLLSAIVSNPNSKLLITGHSLGGAVAIALGMQLEKTHSLPQKRVEFITFGTPAMGNKEFLKETQMLPICAYEFSGDLIPNLFQIFKRKYSGELPGKIVWTSKAPLKTLEHSMIFYAEEAKRQKLLGEVRPITKHEAHQKEFYIVKPVFINSSELPPTYDEVYTRLAETTLCKTLGENRSFLENRSLSLMAALEMAKSQGYRYLLYSKIASVRKSKSIVTGDYYIKMEIEVYDVLSGRLERVFYYNGDDGEYTMLLKLEKVLTQIMKKERF